MTLAQSSVHRQGSGALPWQSFPCKVFLCLCGDRCFELAHRIVIDQAVVGLCFFDLAANLYSSHMNSMGILRVLGLGYWCY